MKVKNGAGWINLETLSDRSRGRLLARVCREKRLLTLMNPNLVAIALV
ncbi:MULTISPECIES: hypothetical protein [unclassified Coleofasciculus]|nr:MULTISPECIES: hypothetical protein [unclassified Coleofasciculus]MBD2086568.1 hypothetical protein [Coleofasciculus sp. FACHB-542]MBD2537668.1 hypothetical protein [Coleofasciculus sp. FACHB-SPT36]